MAFTPSSRRDFLKSGSLLAATAAFAPQLIARRTQQKGTFMLYVGTYAKPDADSIFVYRLNAVTGELIRTGAFKGGENPSFLTLDAKRRFLYAVNETTNFEGKDSGAVGSFAVDPKTGGLQLLNRQPTLGGAPCYISLDKTGKFALVANYVGGNIAAFPISPNGQLGAAAATVQHEGSGPNTKRQEKAHAHCIILAPDNRFVFAVDLGIDRVRIYRFDPASGQLTPNEPSALATKPGAGPRHLTFHPNGRYAYLINELDSSMTALAYDKAQGTLRELQTLSTLPQGFAGENFCADVHVSPNGQFLYGSNRGHNSIAVFAINGKTGQLTPVEHVSTGGKWPRNFTLDPTGKVLLVANQQSNNIVSFTVNPQTGRLTQAGQATEVPGPVCLKLV